LIDWHETGDNRAAERAVGGQPRNDGRHTATTDQGRRRDSGVASEGRNGGGGNQTGRNGRSQEENGSPAPGQRVPAGSGSHQGRVHGKGEEQAPGGVGSTGGGPGKGNSLKFFKTNSVLLLYYCAFLSRESSVHERRIHWQIL